MNILYKVSKHLRYSKILRRILSAYTSIYISKTNFLQENKQAITGCELRVTGCGLRGTRYGLRGTS